MSRPLNNRILLNRMLILFFFLNAANTPVQCQNEPADSPNSRFPVDFDNFHDPAAWISGDTITQKKNLRVKDGQLIFGKPGDRQSSRQGFELFRYLQFGILASEAWRLECRVQVPDSGTPFRITIGLSWRDRPPFNEENGTFYSGGVYLRLRLSSGDDYPLVEGYSRSPDNKNEETAYEERSVLLRKSRALKLSPASASYYLSLEQLNPQIGRLWIYTDENKSKQFSGSPVYFKIDPVLREMNVIEVKGESESSTCEGHLDELRFFNRRVLEVPDLDMTEFNGMASPDADQENVIISPNPCGGTCMIDFRNEPGNYSVEFYDLNGQRIAGRLEQENPLLFIFPDCAPGIYIMRIKTAAWVATKRIIRL
ncbi:MAG TPA: T9SS type A sorting domain-containing protein [Bacteroidia bacterium]|jgi:hypothetical protein|nr:T9SS type A sorting domain-containing protein [Bacteroidia bacterium]